MIGLGLIAANAALTLVALWLWSRLLGSANRMTTQFAAAAESPLVLNVRDRVQEHVDGSLLAGTDGRGLKTLPVPRREPHDPYHTVDELITHIAGLTDLRQLANQEKLIKALYQLQDALALPDSVLLACLQPVLDQLRQASFMDKAVGSITLVKPGDRIDSNTMWPLNRGTRVQQPLGVVIRDPDGKVLTKAKVFCA